MDGTFWDVHFLVIVNGIAFCRTKLGHIDLEHGKQIV